MTLQEEYGSYLAQGGILGVYCPKEILFRVHEGQLQWAEPLEDLERASWSEAPGYPEYSGVVLYSLIHPHPCATKSCFGCGCT